MYPWVFLSVTMSPYRVEYVQVCLSSTMPSYRVEYVSMGHSKCYYVIQGGICIHGSF